MRPLVLALLLLSSTAFAQRPGRFARMHEESGSYAGAVLCAERAMSAGNFALAADQFRTALAIEPDNLELTRQALLASLLGNRPDAQNLAWQVAASESGNPVAQLVLAGQAAIPGNWAEVARHFSAMSPEGVFGLMQKPLLAWAQFGAGRRDAGAALSRGGGAGGALTLQQALMADLAGHDDEAARLYEDAGKKLGADDFHLARAFASFEARHGRNGEALKTLSAALESGTGLAAELNLAVASFTLRDDVAERPVRNPSDGIAAVYAAFASEARQRGAPDLADLLLRLALNLRPDFTIARLQAAQSLGDAHREAEALALLVPISAKNPLAPAADLMRAKFLAQHGGSDPALKQLAALEALVPDRPEPWALQGTLLYRRQHDAQSARAFARALDLSSPRDPARWSYLYGRALADDRLGQVQTAQTDLEAALSLAPNEPMLLTQLGLTMARAGHDLRRARSLMERAALALPDDSGIADSAGIVALRAGDVKGAIKSLEQAAEQRPDDAQINAHLGDAYQAAGRGLEARYQWQRALALDPAREDRVRLENLLK